MRGGTSIVSKRHAKANNIYIADFNPQKENSCIMFYNANNLWLGNESTTSILWFQMEDKE